MAYDTFNSDSFRSHFPHLKDLVHLASCSQGALSREVHYALSDMTRSLHLFGAPWGEWMAEVEEARALFAELINTTPDHVAVVPTASAGAYQVASSFNWTGASLVTSDLEFPSVGQVFHAQQAHGARITFIDDREACLEADVWDWAVSRIVDSS